MSSTTTEATHPQHLWDGFWGIQLLHIGQTLGLFGALEEPRTDHELAEQLGLEHRYTRLWCSAAHSCGLLHKEGEMFQTPAAYQSWYADSAGYTSSHVHLAGRVRESLEAVFQGRALPEPPIALKLVLQKSLQKNYEWLFTAVPEAVPRFAEALAGGERALEVGCGMGFGLLELKRHYPNLELFGLEADYDCAREAERATRAVIHIGERRRFENPFDLVVSFRSLALVSEPAQLLQDCFEILKPGGWMVVGSEMETPQASRKSPARASGERFCYEMLAGDSHMRFLDRAEIEKCLKQAGFTIESEIEGPDWGTPLFLCTRPV